MFNTDITLAGDSSSTRTYALRSIIDGSSVRSNPSAPTAELETLSIKHTRSVRDGITVKRHLVRLDLAKLNSASNKVPQAAVYVVMEVPQDSAITTAMVKDMVTQLKNFLDSANTTKIINDEP